MSLRVLVPRASARDETQVRKQGEARTISRENAPPRLYTVPPHSLFAMLMNLNKGYALYGGLQTYGLNLKQPCKAIRNQL